MINQRNIRNFCIISHVDHGKSTLADRLLEATKTIQPSKMQDQYLDRMALERERGITIKMQPCRMIWGEYILNLIDTPGHVDFSYEVSRSLAAVEGAVLLVDATSGIQAQTISNLEMAKRQNLTIIPVINKIDVASKQQIEESKQELKDLLSVDQDDIVLISAKTGEGVEQILKKIIEKIPTPALDKSLIDEPQTRALIFDSEYDFYKGIIAHIRVVEGKIKKGDKVKLIRSGASAEAVDAGFFNPKLTSCPQLISGEIGYIATGLKNIENCRVGDTITKFQISNFKFQNIKPLKGYKEPQAKVFASIYPSSSDNFNELKQGLERLKLNDASLGFETESSPGLGKGFRCGFLGMLHLEIVTERLKRDYNIDLVITSPSVIYKIIKNDNKSDFIYNVQEMPKPTQIKEIQEPWISLEIITPNNYLGQVMKFLGTLRGEYKETEYLGKDKLIVKFNAPLNEIIKDFYHKLKSITSGYGSMNYEIIGYKPGDLVKLDILLAGQKIEAFSQLVHKQNADQKGRKLVILLKDIIPAQQFAVPIQASIEGKIIARETKKALKKDVTQGLYGGDYTRKRKLLEKQKKGKKKIAQLGKVNLPSEVFLRVLRER